MISEALVPLRPLLQGSYLCDKRFHTEDYESYFQPLDEKQQHGLVLGTGDTMEFYILNGSTTRLIKIIGVAGGVRQKHHKKGGQSSARFSRIHENQTDAFVKETCETCNKVYVDGDGRPSVLTLCFGGTGGDSTGIYASASRSPHLKKELAALQICSAVSANTMTEFIEKTAEKRMKFLSASIGKYVVEFLDHVSRGTGKAVYGKDEIRQHIKQLKTIIYDPDDCKEWQDVLSTVQNKTQLITSSHPAIVQYGGLVAISFFPLFSAN